MGNKNVPKRVAWRGYSWDTNSFTGAEDGGWSGFLNTYDFNRVGSEDPNFRVKIKQNLNASGNLNFTVMNASTSDADCTIYWRKAASGPDSNVIYTSGHRGVFFGLNMPQRVVGHWASSDLDQACQGALRIFHRKWTGRRRAVMGIAMAGELGKTIKMLFRPAKALQDGIQTYIRRAKRLARRSDMFLPASARKARRPDTAKIIADTWLEAVFGWQPLIGDLKDAARGLARIATKDYLEREQFRAYFVVPKSVSHTVGTVGPVGFSPISGVNYTLEREQSMASECILYGVWATRLQNRAAVLSLAQRLIDRSHAFQLSDLTPKSRAAERLGFSVEDWAPSIWELIPYSFLVDYFTNIGDIIEASCNTTDGPLWIEEVDITHSFDRRKFQPLSDLPKANFGSRFVSLSGAEIDTQSELRTVVRKGFDMAKIRPTLTFSLPFSTQWLNIAALAAGARPPKPFY
jgi:hypothetical protein